MPPLWACRNELADRAVVFDWPELNDRRVVAFDWPELDVPRAVVCEPLTFRLLGVGEEVCSPVLALFNAGCSDDALFEFGWLGVPLDVALFVAGALEGARL